MKKQLFALFFIAGLLFASCDEYNDIPNGYIETTQEDAITLVLKGTRVVHRVSLFFNRRVLMLRSIL